MTTEDLAPGGEQPETTTTATVAPEPEKVGTPAEGAKAPEATTEEGKEPEAAKTEAEKAAEASEAGKALAKRKQGYQERITEINRKYREEEGRANRLAAQLAQLEGKTKAPNADEYTDPSKLNADQINHALDQRRIQDLKEQHAEASTEADKARAVAWYERVEAFKADAADFEAIAHSAPIGKDTSLMVADMEEGPAVAYHLGKNPAEARRIDRLSDREKAFELGRIAERITSKPLPRVTTAPTPVNAVGGRSSGATPKYGTMSFEEYSQQVAKEMGR